MIISIPTLFYMYCNALKLNDLANGRVLICPLQCMVELQVVLHGALIVCCLVFLESHFFSALILVSIPKKKNTM